jgi:hypothetical protein
MTIHSERSVPNILADLLMQFTVLLRKEGELARTEVSDNLSRLGGGLTMIVIGAVLLMPALVVLLEAAVSGLETTGLSSYWSALIIGGAVFIIGLILLAIGIGRLKPKRLVPNRTIHQLQEDASVAKRQVRTDHDFQRAA